MSTLSISRSSIGKMSGKSPANVLPTCRPASIDSLPQELLVHIADYLSDTSSAHAFARIGRRFPAAAEKRIWRDIDLSMPPGHGVPPALAETAPESQAEMETAGKLHSGEIAEKVRRVLAMGHRKNQRWRVIESLKLEIQLAALPDMAKLLEKIAPTLLRLELSAPHNALDSIVQQSHQWFDAWVLDSHFKIHFPALSYITLGRHTILHVRFLPFLLTSAPNLVSLAACVENNHKRLLADGKHTRRFPAKVTKDTKLEMLRLVLREEKYSEEDIGSTNHCFDTISSLLEHSPLVRRLHLDHPPPGRRQRIVDIVTQMPNLTDLSWVGQPYWLSKRCTEVVDFPCLKRLVLDYEEWNLPSRRIPFYPSVETIYFSCANRHEAYFHHSATFPAPSPAQLLDPDFVEWLRANPKLNTICFFLPPDSCADPEGYEDRNVDIFPLLDSVDAANGRTGIISSIRHGKKEPFHVRLLLRGVEAGLQRYGMVRPIEPKDERILYTVGNGENAEAEISQRSEATWQLFSAWDEEPVPPEVLERMRESEGLSVQDWAKRGVKVGDEAWAILKAWRAAVPEGGEESAVETDSDSEDSSSSDGDSEDSE